MQIQTTCRHTKMTPSLKRFLEQRLAKLERFADVREAHVILASQKYVQTAEVLLKTRRKELVAREESHDLVLSVDRAVDRLERQLKKMREKSSSRLLREATRSNGDVAGAKRSAARAALGRTGAGEEASTAAAAPAKKRGRAARTTVPAEEAEDSESMARPRIVPAPGPGKPLSVDEAALVLLENGQEFVAFVNADTDQLNVLYRRKDGDLGWIAPRLAKRAR